MLCILLSVNLAQFSAINLTWIFFHGMWHTWHTYTVLSDLFMSKEAVSSAGTADGIPGERRISFHVFDRRTSHRYRKPSGGVRGRLPSGGATDITSRTRVGSGGASDLPKVKSGVGWLMVCRPC